MKRVVVAFVLLFAVTALAVVTLLEQRRITAELITECDALIALREQGDLEACRTEAKRLTDSLKDRLHWFPLVLRHERIEAVYQSAQALPYLIDDDDTADFLTAASTMRLQLEILLDSESPSLENIL